MRHDLGVFTAADAVEAAWKAAETACLAAGCELLASSVARDDDRAPAAAFLDARLPPAALGPFLERLGGLGTIGRHATSAQDRTAEVVDVEARLKNMAEFRDNLRKLMATPGARLKDLIEVERELTRVQSELDSLATRRKVLANDTEKVRVSVAFAARPAVLEAGMWLPVKTAVLRAGHVLASSLATLIGLAIALLPWLLLLFGALALRALLRRRRRLPPDRAPRAARAAASSSGPPSRTSRPGRSPRRLAVALHRPARDPGADVALGLLQEALAAGRQVAHQARRRQRAARAGSITLRSARRPGAIRPRSARPR